MSLGRSPYSGDLCPSRPPGWRRSCRLGSPSVGSWQGSRAARAVQASRGGCGRLLSGPAPLSACQGIKGLLAFVLGPPAPGSLHNKVLLRQIPSPLPSAARGQGTQQPGGGAWHLDPVSGAWVVAECGEHLWSYLGACVTAEWEEELV